MAKGEMMSLDQESATPNGGLTSKQRQVLDLLLDHMTSKEIAQQLGISPHTVEQRLRIAREKLGVTRRSDLATTYRQHKATYERTVYQDSYIDFPAIPLPNTARPVEESYLVVNRGLGPTGATTAEGLLLVPAIFMGPTGALMRVGAVFAIASAAVVVGIGGLAMFETLSRIFG